MARATKTTVDLAGKLNQTAFAALIGVSGPAVSQMFARGTLSAEMTTGEMLLAYCSHLREQAAGRQGDGDLNLPTERAWLAREQRIRIELQNAVTRRELAPVVVIEEVLAKAGSRVAGILESIPGNIRRRIPRLTMDELNVVSAEIVRARNIAASVSLDDIGDDAVDQVAADAAATE